MTRVERIRGTANIPMNAVGIEQVEEDAEILHKLGDLDAIFHSSLNRCVQTAKILAKPMPGVRLFDLGNALNPWNLGKFVGQPVEVVHPEIEKYLYAPHQVVPGGESFNQFKSRYLSAFLKILDRSKNAKVGVVGNYRTLVLVTSWIMAGAKNSFDIVTAGMHQEVKTGEILYVNPCTVDLELITDRTAHSLENGVYVIRHGETDWNEPNRSSSDKSGS